MPAPKPSLCLNMIVKNEASQIERCLRSVLPHVKAVAILDTGSTDGTQDVIRAMCEAFDVPCFIQDGAFKDFSQARNRAFEVARYARDVLPWCQHALLMDADMELVVRPSSDCFFKLDATAPSYDMMQKGGAVSYANRRIVNLDITKDIYVGVTHEYIDVPAAAMIDPEEARFIDHADGSNRADKYPRDATLLEAALLKDPNNGRYLYYLGNTYRDWGRPIEAIAAYDRRIALGGWEEETHSAMMNRACCWKDRGDNAKFIEGMLEAYNFRPTRAEPLYDLATYFRDAEKPAVAAMCATAGLKIKRPGDLLFVNDFVYEHGLAYEASISLFYGTPAERERSLQITDQLALDPTCPSHFRSSARSNLYWHTKPLGELCKTFKPQRLDFIPPHGWTAMNPSVEIDNGLINCNIRCVNYRINEHGQYTINGVPMSYDGPAIETRNFMVQLEWNDLSCHNAAEIIWDRPAPLFPAVVGLEDIRLWRFRGDLCFSATVREQSQQGVCQIAMGTLVYHGPQYLIEDYRIISDEVSYEKNWMPMPAQKGEQPRFMYRLDTILQVDAGAVKVPADKYVAEISGSSQLVEFGYGLLAITHEASNGPDGKRTYWHRFAEFTSDGTLKRLSRPFVFLGRQIEFCSGLARYRGGKFLISFGVRDEEAWVATVEDWEIRALLECDQ